MLKPLKEIKNKDKIIYYCKIKQPFPNGMWYGYIEGELVTKEPTKSRCIAVVDRFCKEKQKIENGEIDPEEVEAKKLFKLKYRWK